MAGTVELDWGICIKQNLFNQAKIPYVVVQGETKPFNSLRIVKSSTNIWDS